MKVLELFAGSRSIGKAAERLGMEVFSSDITDFGGIDYVCDVREFDLSRIPWKPDMIWASPPCTGFSVAAIGHHWERGEEFHTPKTDTARLGLELLRKTINIIETLQPSHFFIENPRGMMRKTPEVQQFQRTTVTYCQYGDTRMKPTDIWHSTRCTWVGRPMCKNGAPCHEAAPRGSRTGTQGLKGNHERSKIPDALCTEILLHVSNTL
tara:strand:- start:354 stop:980 length:627 start_codon:yes stop_codon:yes gene_type:complete